ncbi:MAG: site-specific integrase [Kiritimatiellae bacterium]|nr:site-specific integrase [Kiritimatiellia bacterium]
MKSPQTDVLLVSVDGKPLGASGCRKAVRAHCERIGIKPHEGKPVVPHRLRHSFGSLNIEPLGIGLSLVEIKEQLRHSSIQMTYNVYIARNPLHRRNGYERRMEKIKGQSADPVVVPQPVVRIGVRPCCDDPGVLIDEGEAIRRTKALGLSYRSLRVHAMKAGMAEKRDRGYAYSAAFVDDLVANHFTRAEAMDLLKMPSSTFHEWTKTEDIVFVQIGQVSLFKKDVIVGRWQSRRGGVPG